MGVLPENAFVHAGCSSPQLRVRCSAVPTESLACIIAHKRKCYETPNVLRRPLHSDWLRAEQSIARALRSTQGIKGAETRLLRALAWHLLSVEGSTF